MHASGWGRERLGFLGVRTPKRARPGCVSAGQPLSLSEGVLLGGVSTAASSLLRGAAGVGGRRQVQALERCPVPCCSVPLMFIIYYFGHPCSVALDTCPVRTARPAEPMAPPEGPSTLCPVPPRHRPRGHPPEAPSCVEIRSHDRCPGLLAIFKVKFNMLGTVYKDPRPGPPRPAPSAFPAASDRVHQPPCTRTQCPVPLPGRPVCFCANPTGV